VAAGRVDSWSCGESLLSFFDPPVQPAGGCNGALVASAPATARGYSSTLVTATCPRRGLSFPAIADPSLRYGSAVRWPETDLMAMGSRDGSYHLGSAICRRGHVETEYLLAERFRAGPPIRGGCGTELSEVWCDRIDRLPQLRASDTW
jgi:hypothetical protein